MSMNEKTDLIREWHRLDNAATLYSLVTSANNTCIFRLEAVLKHPVNINKLQRALDNIIERFPYYWVNLLPGVFWHYWNTNLLKPRIITDSEYPCEEMPAIIVIISKKVKKKGINIASFIMFGSAIIVVCLEGILDFALEGKINLSWSLTIVVPLSLIGGLLLYLHYRLLKSGDIKKLFQI